MINLYKWKPEFLFVIYNLLSYVTERKAGAVIHTHSKSAVLVTLLCDKEFRISHQEMIKVQYISSVVQFLRFI
jgi:ribulose-5-phosphate 4-epimerase/fuculose-1-phosphate aldolase